MDESVEYWEGTVELAETVTVPPLSVRICRCRVVRRVGSTDVKIPRKQVVIVVHEDTPLVNLYGADVGYIGRGCVYPER